MTEYQLLLKCCRLNSCGRETEEKTMDWRLFLELVRYHRVLPIVRGNLPVLFPGNLPAEVTAELDRRFERHKRRSLAVTARLTGIARLFQSGGIFSICIKGPVLAHQLYGDISARHTGDLDFLIRQEDMARAHDLLLREGFRPREQRLHDIFDSTARFDAYAGSNKHINYFHPEDNILVECHYRLFNNPHLFPVPWEDLRAGAGKVSLGGEKLNVLAPPHRVLYLAVHGAQHKWFRLKWLLDILYLCYYPLPDLDWKQVFSVANKTGLERMAAQGLELARKLLGAPLPQETGLLDATTQQVTRLVQIAENEIRGRLSREMGKFFFRGFKKRAYLFRLRRGVRHKLYVLRPFFYVDANRDIMKLPDHWYFLYYLLGPFLWLYRKLFTGK